MKTVKQVLRNKGFEVWSIGPEKMVAEAIKLMAEKNIGALVVTDEDEVVGILSERDYARKVQLQGRSSTDTPVKDIMTKKVICVGLEHSIEECMALMTDKHIRHLPVFDGEGIIGVISIGDVVNSIISEQQFKIDQLEHYIMGG